MKKGDEVRITATYDEMNKIPGFNRSEILKYPVGYIYRVHKDFVEVRTVSGIWLFTRDQLEEKI